jgi:hypothetical protein
LMMTSSRWWPQSIEVIKTKYTKPLHLQNHKNGSSVTIRCVQIIESHNNVEFFSSFFTFSWLTIDKKMVSWFFLLKRRRWKLETTKKKHCKKKHTKQIKFMNEQKMPTFFVLFCEIF